MLCLADYEMSVDMWQSIGHAVPRDRFLFIIRSAACAQNIDVASRHQSTSAKRNSARIIIHMPMTRQVRVM